MNENLERLKSLVAETSEVIKNLNKETETIKQKNQEERVSKFVTIRDYLFDCYDVIKDLHRRIVVKIDIPNVKCLGYPAETFIEFNDNSSKPINIMLRYVDKHGCTSSDYGREITNNMEWKPESERQYIGPCWFTQQNEYDFVDLWDKETFEKRFAIEVEKALTEKANKANDKYDNALNRKAMLQKGE
ncbi:hypothetical protein [Butyrivibrio sp. INlla21]|uniref:hypothetical protein n=1 Tax=Butyrivibrio sp. INlla21 TaxID=1520811 RepID=UPI0008EDA47D|nr:hypothetical protein [Butyrivibrio sp. INlla21]SFU37360.1 hypothetical protein SAMN02910342_00301 [Butyrivibrio sp. INlla21]